MLQRFIGPGLLIAVISLSIWIIFRIIVNVKNKNPTKISLRKEVVYFAFYTYIIAILSLTVFPLPFKRFKDPDEQELNLIPFSNILRGVKNMIYGHENFFDHSLQNILGNIALFLPLGIFLPIIFRNVRSLLKVTIIACLCSACIESSQLISQHYHIYRSVDIDDVILNTSGAMLGYAIRQLFFKEVVL